VLERKEVPILARKLGGGKGKEDKLKGKRVKPFVIGEKKEVY